MTIWELNDVMNLKEVKLQFHTSTIYMENFEITKENHRLLMLEALKQIDFLLSNHNLNGLFMLDWRVNFYTLFEYVLNIVPKELWGEQTKKFLYYFDDLSVDVMYYRFDVEDEMTQ